MAPALPAQSARPPGQGVLKPRPAHHPASPGRVRTLPFPPRQATAGVTAHPWSPKKSAQKSSSNLPFFLDPNTTPKMLQKKPPGEPRVFLGGLLEPDRPKNVKFPGGNFGFFGFFLKTRKCAETLVFTTLSGGRRVPKRTPHRCEHRPMCAMAEKTQKNREDTTDGTDRFSPGPEFCRFCAPGRVPKFRENGPLKK